jgi:hypothetical protein
MKKQKVYMCRKGHLHYNLDEAPEECKYCGETEFGLIQAENMEDDDELSEES